MTTHYVDTEAVEQSAHWLTSHRSELERMVVEVRHRVEILMHEALQVPGIATELQSLHQEYERGCTYMTHGLEGLIQFLQRIVMQYNTMGATGGTIPVDGGVHHMPGGVITGGTPTHGPINTIPSGATGGTIPVDGGVHNMPGGVITGGTPTHGPINTIPSGAPGVSLPMDSHAGMTVPTQPATVPTPPASMATPPVTAPTEPAVVTPTVFRPHLA
jgi:hypothetical protein